MSLIVCHFTCPLRSSLPQSILITDLSASERSAAIELNYKDFSQKFIY